jgi:hypothetical protein
MVGGPMLVCVRKMKGPRWYVEHKSSWFENKDKTNAAIK